MTADAVWLKGGATYMRLGSCLKVRAEHTLKLFAVYSLRLCKRSSSSCNAMADTSVDATSLMYSAPAVVSEPYPAVQGMSPNAATAMRGSAAGERRVGGALHLQMPVGYGSIAPATGPLTNGISAASGGQGTTQRDGQRLGAADVSGGRPLATPALVQSERGPRTAGLDGVTSYEGVQGRVGVEQPSYASTMHEQPPLLPPAPADHQQPHVPAQRQQAAAQMPTSLAGGDLRDDGPEEWQGQAATAGTRLSAEAHRAMSQLASQRAALVQALQARARGNLGLRRRRRLQTLEAQA